MGTTTETPNTYYTWGSASFDWESDLAGIKTWAAAHTSDFDRDDDEAVAVAEVVAHGISPNMAEGFTAGDTLALLATWVRDTAEGFTAADAAPAHAVGHNPDEGFTFEDYFLRNSGAIIGDLEIRDEGMTLAQFQKFIWTRSPVDHDPFKELVPGDYSYENALFWLRVDARDNPQDDLAVTSAELIVDVPDVTDRGNDSVGSSGTTINFARTFTAAPEVTVTPKGSTLALPLITAVTTSGFTVELYDPSSPATKIAGDITWTATGY